MLRYRKLAFQSLCLSVLFTANVFASKLTRLQQVELRKKGTVTVYDEAGRAEGRFDVKFMPGSDNVRGDMKSNWKKAKERMKDYVTGGDFWRVAVKEQLDEAKDFIQKCNKNGVCRIKEDFADMKQKNAKAKGQFGENVQKVKNGLEFAGKAVGRSIYSVGGSFLGALYGVVVPSVMIVGLPFYSALQAVVPGTVVPVAKFAWKGAAWLAVKNSNEPATDAPSFMITYTKL